MVTEISESELNNILVMKGFGTIEELDSKFKELNNRYKENIKSLQSIYETIKGQTDLTLFLSTELLTQINNIQTTSTLSKSEFDNQMVNILSKLQNELRRIKFQLTSDNVNDLYPEFIALKKIWDEIIEKYLIKFMTHTKTFNTLIKELFKKMGSIPAGTGVQALNSTIYYTSAKVLMKDLERRFGEYLNSYDFEGKIKVFIKSTTEGTEYLSESEFDIDALADEIVEDIDVKEPYRYYGSSKSGIVYLESLTSDYVELSRIDYSVLIDNVFKRYPSVTNLKLKIPEDAPMLSLTEIMSNATLYLNKPIKFTGIVTSLLKPKTRFFRAKIIKKDEEEIAYFILPQSVYVDNRGRKVKIVPNDEDNIEILMQRGMLLPLPEETENYGSQMQTIPFVIENDLVNKLQIGERYIFYGIPFRDDPSAVESPIVILITNAIPYKKREIIITKEDIEMFKKFKGRLDILIESYAPHITITAPWDYVWSMKLASLLVAVGVPSNINSKYRDTLNVLFIGSPGIAKSVIASELAEIIDKVLYASGKGASGVGITASVVKDEITGKRTVQAGVIPLANGGVAIIDEFDKIKPEDRDMLYEALEKLQITVSKAGLYVILPAKTSIIAVANFDEATQRQIAETGEVDLNLAIRRMKISDALFSRFDLVLLAYDIPDEKKDEKIAEHIIDAMFNELGKTPLDYTLLSKYIHYVKSINPEMPPEIKKKLVNKYIEYRKNYRKRVFTPRQLISIIRIVLAIARLKQHRVVTEDDLDDALRLVEISESIIEEATTIKTVDEDDLKEAIYQLLKELKSYPSISFDKFVNMLITRNNYSDEVKEEVISMTKELLLTKFRKNIELLGTEMSSLLDKEEVPVFKVKRI